MNMPWSPECSLKSSENVDRRPKNNYFCEFSTFFFQKNFGKNPEKTPIFDQKTHFFHYFRLFFKKKFKKKFWKIFRKKKFLKLAEKSHFREVEKIQKKI